MNQEPCKLYVSKEKEECQDKTPFYEMIHHLTLRKKTLPWTRSPEERLFRKLRVGIPHLHSCYMYHNMSYIWIVIKRWKPEAFWLHQKHWIAFAFEYGTTCFNLRWRNHTLSRWSSTVVSRPFPSSPTPDGKRSQFGQCGQLEQFLLFWY